MAIQDPPAKRKGAKRNSFSLSLSLYLSLSIYIEGEH